MNQSKYNILFRSYRHRTALHSNGGYFVLISYSGHCDNVSLHLSVRPSENTIVRNHLINQQWANEKRHGGCPIQRGQYFEILILAEPTFYKIAINGQHFCTFNYRLPVLGNS